MKSKNRGAKLRKSFRIIHRDLSFFFAGMIIIYALSGLYMNHRGDINPHYTITKKEYKIAQSLSSQSEMNKAAVLPLLKDIDEADNYTKHYFPKAGVMKVFLKGGSNLVVDITTGDAVYESVKKRPLIAPMARLHYNPGRWWTIFADCFAVSLILITLTGLFMIKGNKGIIGRGGIELILGIAVPLIFLFFF